MDQRNEYYKKNIYNWYSRKLPKMRQIEGEIVLEVRPMQSLSSHYW